MNKGERRTHNWGEIEEDYSETENMRYADASRRSRSFESLSDIEDGIYLDPATDNERLVRGILDKEERLKNNTFAPGFFGPRFLRLMAGIIPATIGSFIAIKGVMKHANAHRYTARVLSQATGNNHLGTFIDRAAKFVAKGDDYV